MMLRTEAPAPSIATHPADTLAIDWESWTLVDLLVARAADDPSLVLYTYLRDGEDDAVSLSAGALAKDAFAVGATVSKYATAGERAVLLYDDGLDAVIGLFGCLAAGLVAVSGAHPSAPRSAERLLGILKDSGATLVLGHARVLAEFQRTLDEALDDMDLRWVAADTIKPANATWKPVRARNEDIAFIQYTSGSSREPKGVTLSHRNVLHNLASQARVFGYRAGSTGVSWLPFSHDMGLIGCVLMAPFVGGRCVLLAPSSFIEDPMRWLRAIARYRANASAAPNFAYDLCARRATPADLRALDLSCWRVAVNGAEPVRADVLRRFAEVFRPTGFQADALRPSYGLAEATLLVSTGDHGAAARVITLDKDRLRRDEASPLPHGHPDGIDLVGCGRGLDGQRLVIVEPKSLRTAAPGEVGEIWVAGPSISAGYFGRAEENALHFAGDLADGHGPYLRTGDLGFMLGDDLFVTGRLRDLLVVRGKNYYPQDLELSAEASHPGIRPGNSACFLMEATGELTVLCEIARGQHDAAGTIAAAIRHAIVGDHGIDPARVVIAAAGSVLKTPSGKIQRARNRADYSEGRTKIIHEAINREADLVHAASAPGRGVIDSAGVEAWFRLRLDQMGMATAPLHPETRLTELGFDSLKIVELKAALQRDFGVTISIADLYQVQDLRALTAHVVAQAGLPPGADPTAHRAVAPTPPRPANRLAEQRRLRAAPSARPSGR